MKFLHTADIHWGMTPDSDKPWSRARAQAIKETFAQVITQAKLRDVDCLFIAGDLFHRQPLLRDLKELNYLFSTIPSVRVVIIAGNHDRIRPSSSLVSFTWCPNVTWIMEEDMTSVYFEDLNLEVHGFSYHSAEITEPRLNRLRAPLSSHIQVLLAHGGVLPIFPWTKTGCRRPVSPTWPWGISTSRRWRRICLTPIPAPWSLWTRRRPAATASLPVRSARPPAR